MQRQCIKVGVCARYQRTFGGLKSAQWREKRPVETHTTTHTRQQTPRFAIFTAAAAAAASSPPCIAEAFPSDSFAQDTHSRPCELNLDVDRSVRVFCITRIVGGTPTTTNKHQQQQQQRQRQQPGREAKERSRPPSHHGGQNDAEGPGPVD